LLLRLLVFFICLPVLAQPGSGPLRFGEKNPLYRLYATPKGEVADTLPAGKWSFETLLSHSNIFERAQNDRFSQDFDLEMTTLNLNLKRGFGSWEVGGEIFFDSYAGGFLDHTIQEFHSIFGLANDNRETVANGRYAFGLVDLSDLTVLQGSEKEQWLFGDTTLHVKKRLLQSDTDVLSFWAQLRVPSGEENVNSSGNISGNIGLAWRRSYQKWHLHGNLSAIWLNPDEPRSRIVNDVAIYGMFAAERQVFGKWSAIVQLDGGSQYVDNTGLTNLDDPPLNFILGVQTQFASSWNWQFGFSEDLLADGPSVDFSVETSLRKTF
jgi:hypothetical protein